MVNIDPKNKLVRTDEPEKIVRDRLKLMGFNLSGYTFIVKERATTKNIEQRG